MINDKAKMVETVTSTKNKRKWEGVLNAKLKNIAFLYFIFFQKFYKKRLTVKKTSKYYLNSNIVPLQQVINL